MYLTIARVLTSFFVGGPERTREVVFEFRFLVLEEYLKRVGTIGAKIDKYISRLVARGGYSTPFWEYIKVVVD